MRGTDPRAKCSDRDFIHLIETIGPAATARKLKCNIRNVYSRRTNIERRSGRQINIPKLAGYRTGTTRKAKPHPERILLRVNDGIVLVGGDGHYWPGKASTAHRAFVKFCKLLKPKAVIMNGDAFDGATVSRHSKLGWEDSPTVVEELEAVTERLSEIERAAPRNAVLTWPLGNHDSRFETRLATVAPEYARVHGFHLKDHVGVRWQPCWATWINSSVVVKHRWKGGAHAAHNNAAGSGKTMVTNHLHSAKVVPYDDYNGTRYGVDTGCLADPYSPQFRDYSEDNPRNHRAGFVVLTFRNGKLMLPELVLVVDRSHVQFRGEIIKV